MSSKIVVALLSLCCMLVSCTVNNINIEANSKDNRCGKKVVLGKDDEATIIAKGEIPGAECQITFETTECGVCFQFEKYALFNSSLANLAVTVDTMEKMININNSFPMQYICSDKKTMMMKITHKQGYMYNPDAPGYRFVLDIYNKCGYRGTAKSVSFADVYKHAKGYHHGEEMKSRTMTTLITGLVVGLCLASVFLVVLACGYCYVKNSPNRGASKSAGMPRVGGGRGNMNVQSGEGQNKPEVEMVAYKAKEGERPEGKPLLTGAAAATVLLSQNEKKPRKISSGSSASSVSIHDVPEEKVPLKDSTPALIEPVVTVTSDSHTTSGGDSGHVEGSSDHTSGGGGGTSDYTSGGGGGGYSYSGGDYSSGGGGSSSGGGGGGCGGGGGGGGGCGGGGGGGCGGGGGDD